MRSKINGEFYIVKRSNFEIDRFTMWNIREMLWRLHVKTVYLETTASFMVKRSNLKIDRFAVYTEWWITAHFYGKNKMQL